MDIHNFPGSLRSWRDPVASVSALPEAGNREGDTRIVMEGPYGLPVVRIWKGGVWTAPDGEGVDQWLSGAGAPENELGRDGQYYVDTAAPGLDFYVKSGGEWAFSGQLRGPAGEAGGEGGADTGQLMGFDEGVFGDAAADGEPLPDTVTAEIVPYEIELFDGDYEGPPPAALGNPGALARDTAAGDGQNAIWYRHGRTGWELLGVTASGAILETSGAPDNGTGDDMDLAVDTAAGKAYFKDSGSWSEVYDIGTQLGVAMASLRFAIYSGAAAREAARLEDIQALDGDAATDGFSVGWYDHSDPQVAVVFTAGSPTAETPLGLRRWRAAIRRDGADAATRISTYAVRLPAGPALVMLDRTQPGSELAAFAGPLLGGPGPFVPMVPVVGAAFCEGQWQRVLSVDADGWPVLEPVSGGAAGGMLEVMFDSGATPDGETVFSDWESMMGVLMAAIAGGAAGARIRCRSDIDVPPGGVEVLGTDVWPVDGLVFINAKNSYSTGGNASPVVITLGRTVEEMAETARAVLAGQPEFSGGPFEIVGESEEDFQWLTIGTAGGNPESGTRLVLDDVRVANESGAGVIGSFFAEGAVVIGRGRTRLDAGSVQHDAGHAPLVLLDGQSVLAENAVVGIDDDSNGVTVVQLTQETRASTVHPGYSGTVTAVTPDRLGDSMDDPDGAPAAYTRLDLSNGKLRISDGAGNWETVTLDT